MKNTVDPVWNINYIQMVYIVHKYIFYSCQQICMITLNFTL